MNTPDITAATPHRNQTAHADRDRFVPLAFCWADLLLELDAERTVTFASGAVKRLTGRSVGEVVNRPIDTIIFENDRAMLKALLAGRRALGRIEGERLRLHHADGRETLVSFSGYRLPDWQGRFFIALREVGTADPESGQHQQCRDPETGTLDAASFAGLVRRHVTGGRGGDDEALTFLGVQNFEQLRPRLAAAGHGEALAMIGHSLLAHSLNGSMAGRIADDRFALVHGRDLDVADLQQRLDDIMQQVDPIAGAHVVTGTLELRCDALNDEELADSLIFAINRFRTSSGSDFNLQALSQELTALASHSARSIRNLKAIIRDSDFHLAFQPIVNPYTGEIHHYEALFRFPPHLSIASPFEQICLAEQTGLITTLDLAVARKTIDWLMANTAINSSTRVAINISGRSINCPNFVEELNSLLMQNPWTQQRLIFEITESSRVADLESANAFIQSLRKLGYLMCLDDFGAGASNFEYLSKIEVDFVKLDGSAVRHAVQARKGKAFLKALVTLCEQLGVSTVAEMVEDEHTLAFVRDCGIHFVQGYVFGMPAADIRDFSELQFRRLTAERGKRRTASQWS